MMGFKSVSVFAVFVASCGTSVVSDSPIPSALPEDVGMRTEVLDQIRPAMERFVDDGLVSGIVTLVARRGVLVHWEVVGYRNIEDQTLLEKNDIFRICSMSKPITSVGVMRLVEAGALKLDDPISDYLPTFSGPTVYTEAGPVPADAPITIADLLGHTSGLTYGFFGDTVVDSLYREADIFSSDLQHLVDAVTSIPLIGHPGTLWNYSISTDVLGRLIEVISGQPFDAYLKTEILDPLGMQDTGFFVPVEEWDRLATNYNRQSDGTLEEGDVCGSFDGRPELLSGGGGLVSTAADYVRFSQMLINGGELDGTRILRSETVQQMRTNRLSEDILLGPGVGFGLGFSVITDSDTTPESDSDGVYGWNGLASTYFRLDPEEELVSILLTQRVGGDRSTMEEAFQNLVYDAIAR